MRVLRLIHRWLGLALAIPLAIQGLTGAILAFEPGLSGWGAPAAEIVAPGALVEAARLAAPALRPARLLPPTAAGAPAIIRMVPPDRARGPAMLVRIDPVTAQPIGAPEPDGGAFDWVWRLHKAWLIPELGGRQLAGWCGAGLVLLILLGIPLWWPRRGAVVEAFTVPRRARGARLQRRLHGALGGWLAMLLLITGVTGITQGFPQTTRGVLGLSQGGPGRGAPLRGSRGGPATAPDLDAALRLAHATAPGTALRGMILPNAPTDPVRLILGPPGSDGATTATTILTDPTGTRILSIQSPQTASAADLSMRWLRDLHVADGLGPAYRAVMVVTGLLLPAFGMTGFLLWLLKRRNRLRVRARLEVSAA